MKRLLFLLTAVLTVLLCPAQKPVSASEQAQMVRSIEQAAAGINSLECDFVQVKELSLLGDNITSRGHMYFKKPGKLCWQYTSPTPFAFVVNGDKVLIRANGKQNVMDAGSSRIFQEVIRIMMSSVTGSCLTDKSCFSVTMAKDKGLWVAKLVPVKKELKRMFASIVLRIDPQRKMVKQVTLVEKSGDRTDITLHNTKLNTAINDQVFRIH